MQQNQVCVTKQQQFASDTRQSGSPKSPSQDLSLVMAQVGLQLEGSCDYPDDCLPKEFDNDEAERLMHWKLPDEENENTEIYGDKQTVTTNGSHHVQDLDNKFEPHITEGDEEGISATQAKEDEAIGVGDAIDGIGKTVKGVIHTAVDKFGKTLRCVLPKSLTDKDQGNIHVQHPNLFGDTVSLGMNIHKVNKGHLVQTVTEGGLAYKADIKEEDVVRKVNDNDVESWNFEKLQEFFGNQQSIVFKLEIERQKGVDENGQPLLVRFTVEIKLSFEDDQVVAEVDVTYRSWPLSYSGDKPCNLPEYFIYQEGPKTSKFLSLDNSFCGMTTKVTTNCYFKMFIYKPSVTSPRILYNVGMSRPLDLGKESRVGEDNGELTGSGINTANDTRFFYYQKQKETNMYVFELIARKNCFLTVDNDGTIMEKYFPGVNSVTDAGLFNIVEAPSSLKKDKK